MQDLYIKVLFLAASWCACGLAAAGPCGPSGARGVCCPIISSRSPRGCGIRFPSMLPRSNIHWRADENMDEYIKTVSSSADGKPLWTYSPLTERIHVKRGARGIKSTSNVINTDLSTQDMLDCSNEEINRTDASISDSLSKEKVPKADDCDINIEEIPSNVQFTIGGKIEDRPWPWIVSVYFYPSLKFACAGTLIDAQNVLSAAHCYSGKRSNQYSVVVGELAKAGRDRSRTLRVRRVFVHEGFRRGCLCDDVALLRLAAPLRRAVPACMPLADPALPPGNTTLLGWGDRHFEPGRENEGGATTLLQRVDDLPLVCSDTCGALLGKAARFPVPSSFASEHLCAGLPAGGKDACVGDSGGPLLHEDLDGLWSVMGVVSFGYRCGEPNVPGTYTRVSHFLPWIEQKLAARD